MPRKRALRLFREDVRDAVLIVLFAGNVHDHARPEREEVSVTAPGRDSVRGARTDAYRLVWCACYSLEGGETRTAREFLEYVDPKGEIGISPVAVLKALRIAAECKLVTRLPLAQPSGKRRWLWQRLAWPASVSVAKLVEKGARHQVAQNLLHALEAGGYMRSEFKRRDA